MDPVITPEPVAVSNEITEPNIQLMAAIETLNGRSGLKDILVVDFDKALFFSPHTNRHLWDDDSIRILNKHLGPYSWWHAVETLQTAAKAPKWNEDLLLLLESASSDPNVFTIITTSRPSSIVPEIAELLRTRLPNPVDLIFSCEKTFSQRPKALLIRHLWTEFEPERLIVFEGHSKHIEFLRETIREIGTKTHPGLLLYEVASPHSMLPPLYERQLARKLIENFNNLSETTQFRAQSRVVRWECTLEPAGRRKLIEKLNEVVGENLVVEYVAHGILLCSGHPSYALAQRLPPVNTTLMWTVKSIECASSRLYANVECVDAPEPSSRILLARLRRPVAPNTSIDILIATRVRIVRRLSILPALSERLSPVSNVPKENVHDTSVT